MIRYMLYYVYMNVCASDTRVHRSTEWRTPLAVRTNIWTTSTDRQTDWPKYHTRTHFISVHSLCLSLSVRQGVECGPKLWLSGTVCVPRQTCDLLLLIKYIYVENIDYRIRRRVSCVVSWRSRVPCFWLLSAPAPNWMSRGGGGCVSSTNQIKCERKQTAETSGPPPHSIRRDTWNHMHIYYHPECVSDLYHVNTHACVERRTRMSQYWYWMCVSIKV